MNLTKPYEILQDGEKIIQLVSCPDYILVALSNYGILYKYCFGSESLKLLKVRNQESYEGLPSLGEE